MELGDFENPLPCIDFYALTTFFFIWPYNFRVSSFDQGHFNEDNKFRGKILWYRFPVLKFFFF